MKKLWIIPVAIIVLGALVGGVMLLASQKEEVVTPGGEDQVAIVPTPTPEELAIWQDPAGFSFKYPKSLTTNTHEDDDENYAHLELTHAAHPGNIIVWASDLPRGVSDIGSWASDKKFATGSAIDTTFGGEDAKKILFGGPPKKMYVGTIFDGLLFYSEGTLVDSEYWTGVFDTIANSFSFKEIAPAPGAGGSTAGGVAEEAVDETEVVE